MRSPWFIVTATFAVLGGLMLFFAPYGAFALFVIALCCAVLGFFSATKLRKDGHGSVQLH